MDNIPLYPSYEINPPSYGVNDPFNYIIPDVPTLSYREIILNKINQITTVGFTIDEFQKTMVIFCLIRFIIYSIKYNPITSFKICAIGSVSCLIWAMALNGCVRFHFTQHNMDDIKLLSRIATEEEEYIRVQKMVGRIKYMDTYWKKATGQMSSYHFEWIRPIFDIIPKRYSNLTEPIYEYIRTDLFYVLKSIYKTHIKSLVPMMIYGLTVRVGKRFMPYHTRWHATLYFIWYPLNSYSLQCASRFRAYIADELVPNRRYTDAENLRIYLGALAFAQISFCMYAMLHAIFSQYFYIPFLVQNTELHVGPRTVHSIYSGGYTAWQDSFVFYDLNLKETLRLWWGFLGRGTKRDRDRRKNRKKRK
jgi:hypothetical protein